MSSAPTHNFTVSAWPSEKKPEYAVFCGPTDVKEEPSYSDGVLLAFPDVEFRNNPAITSEQQNDFYVESLE